MLFGRRAIVETLVWPFMVVEVEVAGQSGLQLAHRVVLVEIDVLIFDATLQAFAEYVVEGAAAAVHADLDVGCRQAGGEGIGRELCALVDVENLGAPLAERFVQGIKAEDAVQRVGELPREHVAAVPVDDSDPVHEAPQHRHVGDVSAPDLVDMRNRQVTQEIRIELVPFVRRTAASPGVDNLNSE